MPECRILVPLYNNAQSLDPLEHALTEHPGASITVLYVIDPFESDHAGVLPPLLGYWGEWYASASDRAENVLSRAESLASRHDAPIETDVAHGRAPQTIVAYAESNGYDQIVVALRKASRVNRVLSGGVALGVVRRTSLPVTIL